MKASAVSCSQCALSRGYESDLTGLLHSSDLFSVATCLCSLLSLHVVFPSPHVDVRAVKSLH